MVHLLGLFLNSACIDDIRRDALDFPDNPTADFDGDNLTEQQGDCNDLNADVGGVTVWYADTDSDGFGDQNVTTEACEQPEGYVENAEDCLDSDVTVFPGNARYESVGLCVLDVDDDGFGDMTPDLNVDSGTDCDDNNPNIHPDMLESCDGIDNDCNGEVDEYNGTNAPLWFLDADLDGYGRPADTNNDGIDDDFDNNGQPDNTIHACNQPQAYVNNPYDCDDSRSDVFPNAPELCEDGDLDGDGLDDMLDNNCNGVADEPSAVDVLIWYADADNDGFGNPSSTQLSCEQPLGYVMENSDCNDNNVSVYPEAAEYCNGVDDDCDGVIDEDDALDVSTWYYDGDGDGYGAISQYQIQCLADAGYILTGGDCDDSSTLVRPDAAEYCNNEDDDCDGLVDEGAIDMSNYYLDLDSDGYGSGAPILSCPFYNPLSGVAFTPFGYSSTNNDCDDSDPDRAPGFPELCTTTVDENCDQDTTLGAVDISVFYADSDGDGQGNGVYSLAVCSQPFGYVSNSDDCNDNDDEVLSGMAVDWEICNGKIDRCENDDGQLSLLTDELDLDGDGYVTCILDVDPYQWGDQSAIPLGGEDCDDSDPLSYPLAVEQCNGVIDDCFEKLNGSVPLSEVDNDGDGYVECETDMSNWVGDPSVIGGLDCNDSNPLTYVGAASSNPDICTQDMDGDGFPDCNLTGIHPDYFCDFGVFTPAGEGPDFVLIPSGDDPLGRYSISYDYYMMTTEVTDAIWDGIMGLGTETSQVAANEISWHMMAELANELSSYQGYELCYSCSQGSCIESIDPSLCQGYRLPTEAEWEFAARSYSTSDIWTGEGVDLGGVLSDSLCGSNTTILDGASNPPLTDFSIYCDNNTGTQSVVAQLKPNGFGLYDMHGNLKEWTSDFFQSAFPVGQINPWSNTPSSNRVMRSGSYSNYPFQITSAFRYFQAPLTITNTAGGRLVIRSN